MKLTRNELAICDNGLDMEHLLKKKKRALKIQKDKNSISRKLRKAEIFGVRTGQYARYDDSCEQALYLRFISTAQSKSRKRLKNLSNRLIRRAKEDNFGGKGSKHKRITEYWWIVY